MRALCPVDFFNSMYKTTVGLEIHIELATKSKMFCKCVNNPDEAKPNVNICPVCMGYPGTLPVINKEAVKRVIKTGLALNCRVASDSFFERKNYFYPDLPKGYQISQYQAPLCRDGCLWLPNQNKKIRIERIHLEEDTASLLHPEKADHSLVNFNRAGVPLMELVTEPDINSATDAKEFIKELQLILRYLNVSNADMEKGEMRCEVNISLAADDAEKLGIKVEVKNLNSIKSVEKSIEFEIKRQAELLDKKQKIVQETRGWHDKKEITFSQREKESAHDYRYFPEPDLPFLSVDNDFLDEIGSEIPELPLERRKRLGEEFGLSGQDIELFVSQKDLGEYFEKVVSELCEWSKTKKPDVISNNEEMAKLVKLAANYISTDLQFLLKEAVFEEKKSLIGAENFAEFIAMIYKGEISSRIAKMVLAEMFKNGGDPSHIIIDKGWQMVSDDGEIEKAVQEVIAANFKAVADYKKGKQTSLQFLIGQVMVKTSGKASPQKVQEVLKNLIR